MLSSGADIVEINTVRKRLSKVKGGRNQEIALSAALQIDGIRNAAVFSIGSDGTDGPTGTNVNDVAVILIGKKLGIVSLSRETMGEYILRPESPKATIVFLRKPKLQ